MKKFFFILIGVIGCVRFPLVGAVEAEMEDEPSSALMRDEALAASEFMIRIWKTGEGLPGNEIHDLKETPDGYLWLGTPHGLVRFDGVRFQSFFSTPTGRRYGSRIAPLETDSDGRLWFAPDETGLGYLEGRQFNEVLTNETVLKARVSNLCRDGTNGLMWVDANGGLGQISNNEPAEAQLIKGGGASGSSRWLRDFKGELWLENPRNLRSYSREGKWRNVALPGTATLVSTPRRAGGLWVARDAKLRFVNRDGEGGEVATFPWVGRSRVTCLMEDRHQRLWIGTVGEGLYCFSAGEFQKVAPIANSMTCLFEDDQDNIWAGTRGGGLIRVRQRQFFVHDINSGLGNQDVRSIAEDQEGRVWVLSAEGKLGWSKDGSWKKLGPADGWRGQDSLSVHPSKKGGVWISTMRRGIWRWNNGKFTRHDWGSAKGLKEPPVDLLEDSKGRLWMVTDNSGIYCLNEEKLARYTVDDGLPSMYIRRLIEDENGEILAGDWEGGIARFRDQRWKLMRKPSGHSDAVRSMVASKEALWIGTSAGGLLRLKNGETARVSVDEGLPSSGIQQLLLDNKGSLWGGTSHRLFRVAVDQLNAVMDGRSGKLQAILYGAGDGLPDVSFASWCDPRSWRTIQGELWFATANGVIHFKPETLETHKNAEPPPVLLEQTLMDGKPIPAKALQHLRPQAGRIEFRFTAPCLTAPKRVLFRYQLTGVDPDWVDAGPTRTATYANIPAGDHVFRVIASSPEGIWGTEAATLALSVRPFFWQTNWFLALVAAAFAGGGVWAARWATVRRLNRRLEHLRQQHAVDRERSRIAQDIHDELGANLTSIGLLADMATRHKANPTAVTRELDQISQTARESVAAMDAIVWALNPRNDSLDHFANYVAQFTREFFRPTQLRTRLELPANLPAHGLAMETRHQLFLIVKESFNNIVRHARATEVCLELACGNGHLHLIVADNGRGLSGETLREGANGLTNLRERIERLGGTLGIKSENGQGTRLEFILPLAKFKLN